MNSQTEQESQLDDSTQKVYAVVDDEGELIRLFINYTDAEIYVFEHGSSLGIQERRFFDTPIPVAPKYTMTWFPDWLYVQKPAFSFEKPTIPWTSSIDFPPDKLPAITKTSTTRPLGEPGYIHVEGYDRDAVIAKFNELVEECRPKEEPNDAAWF